MKYVDEFRSGKSIAHISEAIRAFVPRGRVFNVMEVCGTHTMSVFRFSLKELLPDGIRLISGPGCPVCVTPDSFLDKAIWLARQKNVIVATFGDMLKIPASRSSLERERSLGAAVKVVYSTVDAVEIAERNPGKEVVFLGVGFETTAPTVASSILMAKAGGFVNYSVLCGHKTMPQVLRTLAGDRDADIDGFMLPGHVSAVTGARPYGFLAREYAKRCVIAGFEPFDIMQAILMLITQKRPRIEIQYGRAVTVSGNKKAREIMGEVFESSDSAWRGIGTIKDSGLKIRKPYREFDAGAKFDIKTPHSVKRTGCICAEVLKGGRMPEECRLFGKRCRPEHPVGPCMVSSEGTCAAHFKYAPGPGRVLR